ncbi:hypothetical protein [Acidianus manzaensis]|uniref:Uncharacterized protein n=1 Tax=Acidianus manzaensis TaxID=282676 RepID=A0A1W6K2R0_9CREN|nr:hypothetical protein [Acidianus manzaensis]ARM76831.1 hypothetical protein B6F84_12915 [Acidianus manzaensis]
MILATLGSDKSVTTIDAIMTEIFTGVKPNEIRIYREESDPRQNFSEKLKDTLKLLGIDSKIREIVIGDKISDWKDKMSNEEIDILDITPGRKYMAIVANNYSKAKEVRYAYLKEERKGYHVFGYVSPLEIKVYNIRDGKEVNYEPPSTLDGDEISFLNSEGLTSLYNLLSLHGKLNILVGDEDLNLDKPDIRDDYINNCLIRSGFKKYDEEKDVEKYEKQDSFFLADTNTYIKLGNRLGWLTKGKLLASKSVYNELLNKTKNTQKEGKTILFHLGMYSYTLLHRNPPISEFNKSGDIPLIEEAKKIKDNISEQLVLITADRQESYVAGSNKVKSIFLNTLKDGKGDIGELLFCLTYRSEYTDPHDNAKKELSIELNGEETVKILPYQLHEGKSKVVTKNKELNYAKVIEKLYEIVKNQ